MPDDPGTIKPPRIPDHDLVRRVGKGSYGEVWLARSALGTYRALKIVHRRTFDEDRPFEREFQGIQKFEPVSRTHPGFVSILHVGRNNQAGYFYYVMEVADDLADGQAIRPQTYRPMTLANVLAQRGRLTLEESLQVGAALAAALGHLHNRGLVHRDIKPSNIIFVTGAPKFADIGLVTDISEAATFVGTAGYIAPEGPGSPLADIYGLGKVIYEMVMGKDRERFPDLATDLSALGDTPLVLRLNEIILKACDHNPRRRFQSGEELHTALATATRSSPPTATVADAPWPDQHAGFDGSKSDITSGESLVLPSNLQIAILYKSNVEPDAHLLRLLTDRLNRHGCQIFFDKHLAIGVEWAREIEKKIREADAAIVLLSSASIQSEMIAYEVEIAWQAQQQQRGKPLLLPVRVQHADPLPGPLAGILEPLQYFLWEGPQDDDRLIRELVRSLATSQKPVPSTARLKLESVGGAVPLDSQFYIVRATDHEFQTAIARRDSTVLVKGARQMGKTSLLARGLQQARQSGAKVALTDFQKLNTSHLASVETFFLTLGDFLADQLDLHAVPEDNWDKRRSPNTNFERYLRREVLSKMTAQIVWGLDEVDRLFTCDFGSEVFGLFRSWHNERALDPSGPWSRLTLAIAYATEAHLFITDVNQSPFNVGTRLTLDDFDLGQVADLNQRHGSPLRTDDELRRFFTLTGGQPYLVRRGLNEMASASLKYEEWARSTDREEGLFGDHLRRILVLLAKDPELCEVVRGILQGRPCPTAVFYRLRSAGVMRGDSPQEVRPRCEIYANYLKRHLL